MTRVFDSCVAAGVLAAVGLAACAGSGEGLDENGRPLTGAEQPLVPQLASIQEHVFTPICTACHIGAAAPLGFRLDAESAFAMLVNTPSVEVPSLNRVTPGNPDSSYLIQKLEGHAAVGGQMPLGQPPLPQATIDVIRQWITDGAQAGDSAQAGKAPTSMLALASALKPVRLRAVAPLDQETFVDRAPDILIAAAGELDLASVDSNSVTLERSGGDGSFAEGNEVRVDGARLSVHSLKPTVFALSLPQSAWVTDTYRLTLAGSGPAPIRDIGGIAIDGAGSGASGTDLSLIFNAGTAP